MTKAIVAALLAASSIFPGIASAQDGQGRLDRAQQNDAPKDARADRRADRQAGRGEAGGQQAQRQQRPDRQDARPDRGGDDRQPQRPANRDGGRLDGNDRNGGRFDRDGRNDGRFDRNGGYDRNDRNDRAGWDRRDGYTAQRFGGGSAQRWSNDWRRDGRYDWNRYRSYNRNAFHLPRYYAPGGWNYGYRSFSIGSRFAAPLFGRNYWIANPLSYRLPPAYGSYRWVRYYNDAMLIDLRSGYVADVINGIFW